MSLNSKIKNFYDLIDEDSSENFSENSNSVSDNSQNNHDSQIHQIIQNNQPQINIPNQEAIAVAEKIDPAVDSLKNDIDSD